MSLKTRLDPLTMETAVLGGAVLGCGGGGKLEDGLYLGELAAAQGRAHLVDPNTLPALNQLVIVGAVHTSGSDTRQISPRQAHHAIEMLQSEIGTPIDSLVNAGLGAVDSILGWELSSFLEVPLLDAALPATYHPIPLSNLLLFWKETAATEIFTVSLAGHSHPELGHRQHLWHGNPVDLQQQLDDLPASEIESYVFAAGPLQPALFIAHSRLNAINQTLQVGQAIVATNEDGGEAALSALQRTLPCEFSTFATVIQINWHGHGQDASGTIELRDVNNRHLTLTYSQRYLELLENGVQIIAFPDLIITLGTLGTPLTGEEVFIGQDLYLIVAAHIK